MVATTITLSSLRIETGVVGQGVEAFLREPGRGLLGFVARQAVDDAGVIGVFLFEELEQLAFRVVPRRDAVADVRAVEAGDKLFRIVQVQAADDLGAGAGVGGGGKGDARHVRELLVQQAEFEVIGAEVVAPLADAVGFVDGEQRNGAVGEQLQHTRLA
jgi:hypothetical protein